MNKYRLFGIAGVILLITLALALLMTPGKAGASPNCAWYEQHPPSPGHPNGWGECHHDPKPTDTPTQVVTDEPTIIPTTASPTPADPTETATATPNDPTGVPQTVTPTPTASSTAQVTCENKCTYNLGGLPGTHAVTAVSPLISGPYYWQIKINGIWYDVYDCYGVIITTVSESRGETSITRLIVDSSAPTDPSSYRVIGGAGAILFDDHTY